MKHLTRIFLVFCTVILLLSPGVSYAGYNPRAGRSNTQLDIWYTGSDVVYNDTAVGEYLRGGRADTITAKNMQIATDPTRDSDVVRKSYFQANSYDTFVVDVKVGKGDTHTITHNLGTIVPTVVTFSDTLVPYELIDVPTTIVDENNIRLDVSGETYFGKVKVTE